MPSARSSHLASVRTLLDALHEEQSDAPDELQEDRTLLRMREDLERTAIREHVAIRDNAHRDEMLADLAATTDAELEVLLDLDGDWTDVGGGCWRVRDVTPSASGSAGAAPREQRVDVAPAKLPSAAEVAAVSKPRPRPRLREPRRRYPRPRTSQTNIHSRRGAMAPRQEHL